MKNLEPGQRIRIGTESILFANRTGQIERCSDSGYLVKLDDGQVLRDVPRDEFKVENG